MDFNQWIDKFIDKGADPTQIDDIPLSGGGSFGDDPYVMLPALERGYYELDIDYMLDLLAQKYPNTTLEEMRETIGSQLYCVYKLYTSTSHDAGNQISCVSGYYTPHTGGDWCTCWGSECDPYIRLDVEVSSSISSAVVVFEEGVTLDTTISEAIQHINSTTAPSCTVVAVRKNENNTFSNEEILHLFKEVNN